jgi:cytochrome c oxidase subunit IV
MAKDGLGYSIGKIFIVLFALTAIEVAWGMFFRDPRWFLWSGLLICALLKGILIFMYFMHMKFERVLVWSLILPTPLLMLVFFGYITKDMAYNEIRDYPNGMMINSAGEVVTMDEMLSEAAGHGGEESHGLDAEDGTGLEGTEEHAEEGEPAGEH